MKASENSNLRRVLRHDEGLRLKPYTDTVGRLSIGYGRNLTDVGISQEEADYLLGHDLERAESDLVRVYPIVSTLDDTRRGVLICLTFNIGIGGVQTFRAMWQAIYDGDYQKAANEMLDSTWAAQVGARATRLAAAMASGELP